MKKVNGSGHTVLKRSLLSCVLLFFFLSHMGESMTSARSSNRFLTLATPQLTARPMPKPTPQLTARLTPKPTPQLTARPTSQPTPRPTARPTSQPTPEPASKPPSLAGRGGTQPQQTRLTRQTLPIHSPDVPSLSPTRAVSDPATPTRAMMSRTPTSMASLSGNTRVLSVLPVDAPQQDNSILKLVLLLGLVVPLLLITAATFWFSVKWLLNQRRLARLARDHSDEPVKPRG